MDRRYKKSKVSPDEHPIRTWLRLRRQSEIDFAREVGISPSFLSHLLSGRRGPSAQLMLRLSMITGIPPQSLLKPDKVKAKYA